MRRIDYIRKLAVEDQHVDALLAVIDALPMCWECNAPATKRSDMRHTIFCDKHAPLPYEATGGQRVFWHDFPYAAAIRNILADVQESK
jgi:hypothetical protein